MRRPPASVLRLGLAAVACAATACAHCGDGGPTSAPPAEVRAAPASVERPAPCPAGASLTARGTCVPDAWHCSPSYYGAADGCDCDCGVVDPDCQGVPSAYFCYNAGAPSPVTSCAACAVPRAAGQGAP